MGTHRLWSYCNASSRRQVEAGWPAVSGSLLLALTQHCLLHLCMQPVAVAVLPLRDENAMKNYLLWPNKRHELLRQHSGVLHVMPNALAVDTLLADRTFLCLHYCLDTNGSLHACTGLGNGEAGRQHAAKELDLAAAEAVHHPAAQQQHHQRQPLFGIEDSNVQFGIMLRKGVGGTCTLRHRTRQMAGLLNLLLDDPPAATELAGQTVPCTRAAMPAPLQTPLAVGSRQPAVTLAPVQQQDVSSCKVVVKSNPAASTVKQRQRVLSTAAGVPLMPAPNQTEPTVASLANWLCGAGSANIWSSPAKATATVAPAGHTKTTARSCELEDGDMEEGKLVQFAGGSSSNQLPSQIHQHGGGERAWETVLKPQQQRSYGMSAMAAVNAAADDAAEAARGEADDLAGKEEEAELRQEMLEAAELENKGQCESFATAPPAATEAGHASARRVALYTFGCRLEMYVQRETWEGLDAEAQSLLHTAVRRLERMLQQRLAACNLRRLQEHVLCLAEAVGSTSLASLLAVELLAGGQQKQKQKQKQKQSTDCSAVSDTGLGPPTPAPASVLPATASAQQQQQHEQQYLANRCNIDFSSAWVLAVACTLAADACHVRQANPQIPFPFYLIGTRDSFTWRLVEQQTPVMAGGRTFLRTEWFFPPGQPLPDDYERVMSGELVQAAAALPNVQEAQQMEPGSAVAGPLMTAAHHDSLRPTGCVSYQALFSPVELAAIEAACDGLDQRAKEGLLPPSSFHRTSTKASCSPFDTSTDVPLCLAPTSPAPCPPPQAGTIKRTKFFFGARYLWKKEQLAEPRARIAAGVRIDVPPPPRGLQARQTCPSTVISPWTCQLRLVLPC